MNNPSGEDVGSATLAGYQWHALFGWKLLLRLWQDAEADLVDEAATEYGVFLFFCCVQNLWSYIGHQCRGSPSQRVFSAAAVCHIEFW